MSNSRVIRRGDAVPVRTWRPGELSKAPQPVPDGLEKDAPPAVVSPPEAAPVPPVAVVTPSRPSAEVSEPREPEGIVRAEADRIRSEAHQAGFEAGRAAGLAEARDDVERLRSVLAHLNVLAEDLEQGIAGDVLSLALELSKQIVRQSLRVRPDLVLGLIREAARSFPELGESPRLIVHPADAAVIRAVAASESSADLGLWTVVEDASIERGGCKFQNATTEIDATLETRWRRIVASLGRDDAWLDLNL